jgi:hypothetical protein
LTKEKEKEKEKENKKCNYFFFSLYKKNPPKQKETKDK